jgi:hypothetical protein
MTKMGLNFNCGVLLLFIVTLQLDGLIQLILVFRHKASHIDERVSPFLT